MAISQQLLNAQKALQERRKQDGVTYRHDVPIVASTDCHQPPQDEPQTAVSIPDTVKAYPSLLTAFLAQKEPVAARFYMLLRLLDPEGRGWYDIGFIRDLITNPDNKQHLFTWRRMRQVLHAGDGRFWQLTDNDRIRYYSPAKIAISLECGGLVGEPVQMPASAIFDSLKGFKAYCLASFHAGRHEPNPITRKTIRDITGVSETTQREYDKITDTCSQKNLALTGDEWTKANRQKWAWERGRHVFRFVDIKGNHSKRYTQTIAYRLPNSYQADLAQSPKGRQKRINRAIDLVSNVGRGIGSNVDRFYFQDGNEAGKARNRCDHEVYVRAGGTLQQNVDSVTKLTGVAVWGVV